MGSNLKSKLPEIQRFTKFIQLDILSGCWIWKGYLDKNGYGCFRVKGKTHLAHRFSWEYYNGKIPDKKEMDHLCRNTTCVNPQHLEPVTHRENNHRGRNWERERTHCPQGHEFTEYNTYHHKGHRHCRMCRQIRKRKHSLDPKWVTQT